MTQTGPGSPQQPGGKDDEVFRELTRMQVQVILEAYGADVEVGFDRTTKGDDLADVAYLCRSGAILVRDPDLSRVQRIDLGARVDDALVDGLTRLTLPAGLSVADALERIDAAVGLGVATPDHLLWVTPKSFSCPATEPEEVSVKDSVPTVGRGSEAGRGVLVSVVDTGWHSPAATDPVSPWLAGVTGDEEEITDPSDPNGFIRPYAGHGTFVAGVVRREAPAAEVRVEGFLRKAGAIFESKIVRQLTEAIALGPDIISLSAGSTTRENLPLLSFEVFYERFLSKLKGTVLVAAAGNQGVRKPFWPAAFPWSISV
ncbi:MAG: S8/S53 family peptidase, partial [Marmoricola sp.]